MSIRAWIERKLAPSYGTCPRCERPWHFTAPRPIIYAHVGLSAYCFSPLCEKCWAETHRDERLAYAFKSYEATEANSDYDWPTYRDAVIAAGEQLPSHP